MDWDKLTLSGVRRLVAALNEADPRLLESLIERKPAEAFPNGRVTIESILALLQQTDGCTILPEDIARQLQPAAVPIADLDLGGMNLARDILGPDFITPNEVMGMYKDIPYTPEQFNQLFRTVPGHAVLEWLRTNQYMLTPGPPTPLSLSDLKRFGLMDTTVARSRYTRSWVYDAPFATDEKVGAGWLAIGKEPLPGSFNKTWWQQTIDLTVQPFMEIYVPSMVEVVWSIATYNTARGDGLLSHPTYVRTSTIRRHDGGALHMNVGCFAGREFDAYRKSEADENVGLAIALKL